MCQVAEKIQKEVSTIIVGSRKVKLAFFISSLASYQASLAAILVAAWGD